MEPSSTEAALAARVAFRREPDGTIVVRRWFGADGWALLLSFLGPALYVALVLAAAVLLVHVLPEPDPVVRGR